MAKYLDSTGLTHLVSQLKTSVIPNVKVKAAAAADTATTAQTAAKANSVDAANINGVIPISKIPQAALERVVTVTDDTARYKLTTSQVQLGDTVKVTSTGRMYIVIDESKLTSAAGYMEYSAGTAANVPWTGVTDKPSTFTPSAHSHTATVSIGNAASKTVSTATALTIDLATILGTIASSGSGNAVTALSVSGNTLTVTKGSTFSLSSHGHSATLTLANGGAKTLSTGGSLTLTLAQLLGTITTSGSGNAVTAISVSGNALTVTKGATYATSAQLTAATDRITDLETFTGSSAAGGLTDQLNTAGYDIVPFSGFLTAAPTVATTSLADNAPGLVIHKSATAADGTVTVAGIYAAVQASGSAQKTYYSNWKDCLKATPDTAATKAKLHAHKLYLDLTTGNAYYAASDTTLKMVWCGDSALSNTEIDAAVKSA